VRIVRSFVAVAVGYAVMLAIIRCFAPEPAEGMNYFLLSATCIAAASLFGGLAAALVADGHELAHAAGLGFVMIVMSVLSMRQAGEARPGWYETSLAACGPMAALLGAAIRLLLKPRAGTQSQPVPNQSEVRH
jgi:hypothetical protein